MAASDPQREQLYAIENEFSGGWRGTRASREHLDFLVTDVARLCGRPPPTLRIVTRLPSGRAGQYCNGVIKLSREGEGVNSFVLIHELSHWVIHLLYSDVEDHGPEFVMVLIYLLDLYFLVPKEAFRLLAKNRGIRGYRGSGSRAIARLRASQEVG